MATPRAPKTGLRLAFGCAAFVAVHGVCAAASGAVATSVCPIATPTNDRPPVYLPVGVDGLMRLELSPSFPGGMGTAAVARDEVAMLCAEGFDVRTLDTQSLPAAFSIVRRTGRVYGNLWRAGATPGDAMTQWLRFDVEAIGYFGQGEHVPIALLLDADALADKAIIGSGIVFGEVNLAPNGCGGTSFPAVPVDNSEVEAFWRGGNSLWGESCGAVPVGNDRVYRFFVAADGRGGVRYENRAGSAPLVAPAPVDTSARRPALDAANAGVLIASTNFCTGCSDFDIRFTAVASGWAALPMTDPRIAQPPVLLPTVAAVSFGAQRPGTRSPAQRITFTSTASIDVHPTFAVSASQAPHCGDGGIAATCARELDLARRSFVLDTSGCGTLPAHGTCILAVHFAPQGAFDIEAELEYQAAGIIGTVALQGYGVPSAADTGTSLAIEYFDAQLGHYFVTTLASEQALLDGGAIAGWKRTGQWFATDLPGTGTANGGAAVCRYYGKPEAGLDSHFYSGSADECRAVAERFAQAWVLETAELFDIGLPDLASGACAHGMPVYRLWNARAGSNHRYTTDAATRGRMIGAGWIPEGYGPDGVAMCDASR